MTAGLALPPTSHPPVDQAGHPFDRRADRETVIGLRLGPGQERYLNPIESILAESVQEQRACPRQWAVHDAESGPLVGFTMISDGIPEPMDDGLVGPYCLWKLFVDRGFQRQGYGAAIIDELVGHLATRPGADVLYTSCAGGPGSPRPFYLGCGFLATGRVMWGENVLALDLRGARTRESTPGAPGLPTA